MKTSRVRVTVGALALGLAFAVPGVAQAAKVTKTAVGGAITDAQIVSGAEVSSSVLTQSFALSGKNVMKKQVRDVNVIVNSTGASEANEDLNALLIAPSGDSTFLPIPGFGQSMVNLKFDDQAIFSACNPFTNIEPDCNYLQGGDATSNTGTMTGVLNGFLNPVFKGLSPQGTWKLMWWDFDFGDGAGATIGTTTLEVVTGKKFAKEPGGGGKKK